MARVLVNHSTWPILKITLPETQTDQEVQAYLDELRACRERHEDYAAVIDLDASKGFSPKQRRMQAEHIAAGLTLTQRYLRGVAFVASSTMRRGMLTAIFWLQTPASPYKIFGEKQAATQWAWSQLTSRKEKQSAG